MSASQAVAGVPNAVPFSRWFDPRRSPGGITKAEREFRDARDRELVPEAISVLREMLADSRNPAIPADIRQKCRMDFMRCCGLIQKPTDAAAIQALAKELLAGMIAEARQQRAVHPDGHGPEAGVIDTTATDTTTGATNHG